MKKRLTSKWYHNDQGKERNPMGYVTNTGVDGTTILVFILFYSCIVILQPEE
jgi:hypothetical protein